MEQLAGKRYANDEDLKDAVVTWLNNQVATWYEADYVERYTKLCTETCIFSFCTNINKEYFGMAKLYLLYGRPTYFPFK